MSALTDTHCHLDFHTFDDDREAVLARAWEAGLTRILNPGIDLESSRRAVALAEAHERVFAAVGVHPNDATTWDERTPDELRALAAHPKVVAIGEIGLDYYRDRAPRDRQQRVFRAQLDLAAELGLPVIIHVREAMSDVLAVLGDWVAGLRAAGAPLADRPGVLHSFFGRPEEAAQALELGFLLGITGPVTFKNAPDQQRLVSGLPLSGLILETDAPFLTPHPFRGRRNEPAFVAHTAAKIAELHQQPPSVIAQQTRANAARLFGWE